MGQHSFRGAFVDLASSFVLCVFFFNDTATTEIYTLSLHDALPIFRNATMRVASHCWMPDSKRRCGRSEEHTSELQSRGHLVCRLLLEKKNKCLHVLSPIALIDTPIFLFRIYLSA